MYGRSWNLGKLTLLYSIQNWFYLDNTTSMCAFGLIFDYFTNAPSEIIKPHVSLIYWRFLGI